MKYGTLGSKESNHALVLQRYIKARGIRNADVQYYEDFIAAFDDLASGSLDFVLQVSVHPQHSDCVARYVNRAFIVDTFIAASKPLGILTRRDVETPRSIGLQPATRHYANLSAWSEQIDEVSTSTVAEGLLEGRYDSGVTALEVIDRYPGRFRVDLEIGAIEDVWVLFGRDRKGRRNVLT